MNQPDLLTPAEVAQLFCVNPKTVTRWANNGLIPYQVTLGGHRRYPRDQIEALLAPPTNTVENWRKAHGHA